MRRILKTIIGSLLIVGGLTIGLTGFLSVEPEVQSIQMLILTAPTTIAAIGLIFIGWLIIRGTTWREIVDFLNNSMWP